MKNLLYIGNKLSKTGKTETTIQTLSDALRSEGYTVYAVSNKKNKLWRLLDMLLAILKCSKTRLLPIVYIDLPLPPSLPPSLPP